MLIATYASHPKLSSIFLDTFVLSLDGCLSHFPVRMSPVIFLCVRGGVSTFEADGTIVRQPRFCLSGAHPGPIRMLSDPKSLVIGVQMRPGQLQSCLGISPSQIASQSIAMETLIDSSCVERLMNELTNENPIELYVRLFESLLLSTLNYKDSSRIDEAMRRAGQKLFLPMIDFALHFGIGERQLERIVKKHLGLSVRDCRRIIRFGFALARLLDGATSHGEMTKIAHEEGYYDQAHMHREFVELSGLTPSQIAHKSKQNDPDYWFYALSLKQYMQVCLAPEYFDK